MKTSLLFLTAVIAIIYAKTMEMQNYRRYSEECVKVTGVQPEVLAEAKKGIVTEDEALMNFTLCYFQKVGILDRMGHLDIDSVVSSLPHTVDKTEVKRTLEICKPKKGKNAADTAFRLFRCCLRESPGHDFL